MKCIYGGLCRIRSFGYEAKEMTEEIHLEIAPDIQQRFPEIVCGRFIVEDGPNVTDVDFLSYDEIRAALTGEGITIEGIAKDPRIAAWRTAIQSSGAKPSKVRGSAEQLGRRVLRGGAITAPPLVDLYCRCSARFLAPLGVTISISFRRGRRV